MRKKKLDDILQANETLTEEASRLAEYLGELTDAEDKPFDISAPILKKDASTADLLARLTVATGLTAGFTDADSAVLVPRTLLDQLHGNIDATNQKVGALITHFESQVTANGGLTTFNYDNFHAQTKNGQNIDCRAQFQQLFDTVENLLTAVYTVLPILNPDKAAFDFQAVGKSLSDQIARVAKDHDSVKQALKELERIANTAESLRKSAEDATNEITRLKTESGNERKTIGEYLAEVTEKQEAVDSIHTQAVSLESKINEYAETFESFQRQLDARNEQFQEGTSELNDLITKFKEQRDSVDQIINRSEDMLKSATVAGLAAHFGEIRAGLTTELNSARKGFYAGIALLVVSAIPLLLLVAAPILEAMFPTLDFDTSPSDMSGAHYFGQVIGRIIVLLPAAWLVRFASRRHASLFKLREDYAYKYSMAVSVEGFKKQAPDYESEIAAVVFEQLAFNPAEAMHSARKEEDSPSKLMDMFQKMVAKGMGKLND
ncbi:MAG TPA: hypothetical protein PKH39_17330 [Woeseiaceae bacterium]|nr:hypothetical protein [Woeseiaceae bacterium]